MKAEIKKPRLKVSTNCDTLDLVGDVANGHMLNTVCVEAGCPNIHECWSKKHATFMLLGKICTRICKFCNISKGKPEKIDLNEPKNIAIATQNLKLKHIVITSVDRDDQIDGGAGQFTKTIYELKKLLNPPTIEILTPDFLDKNWSISVDSIISAKPDIFGHNVETVPSLYKKIRPRAKYDNSLFLLEYVKKKDDNIFTKSGIMLGLGETKEEVMQTMRDMRERNIDFITIGQYLAPSSKHTEVKRYVSDEEFQFYKKFAYDIGFIMVSSSALTRSSYHADEDFLHLKAAVKRKKKIQ